MKKYFVAENGQQEGPFSIDELRNKGISRSTLIWFEGLDNWQEASNVNELNELFYAAPPTPPPSYQTPPQQNQAYRSGTFNRDYNEGIHGGGLIAMGYILALLGGAGGIVVGSILWMAKTRVNGQKIKKYNKTSQLHGVFAFFLGIIVWAGVLEILFA